MASSESPVCCIASADTTVWCAHEDGTVAIHEKDGLRFGVITLDVERKSESRVTGMVFAAQCGPPCMVVLYVNGGVDVLDAGTGHRLAQSQRLHRGAVTSACVHSIWRADQSITQGLLSCAEVGSIVHCELPSLEVFEDFYEPTTDEALTCIVSQGGDGFEHTGGTFFAGGRAGQVSKWRTNRSTPLLTTKLDGHVASLAILKNGREVWAALTGIPHHGVLALSALTLDVLTIVDDSLDCIQLLPTHNKIWAVGNEGVEGKMIAYSNSTRLPLASVDADKEAIQCAARVSIVQDDHELWCASPNSTGPSRHRDVAAVAPAWCAVAMQATTTSLETTQTKLTEALRSKEETEEELRACSASHRAIQNEALSHLQRAASAEASSAEATKRCSLVEVRYGDLRAGIITAMHERGGKRWATQSDTDILRWVQSGANPPNNSTPNSVIRSPPQTPEKVRSPPPPLPPTPQSEPAVSLLDIERIRTALVESELQHNAAISRCKVLAAEAAEVRAERDQAVAETALCHIEAREAARARDRHVATVRLLEGRAAQHRTTVDTLSAALGRLSAVEAERDALSLKTSVGGNVPTLRALQQLSTSAERSKRMRSFYLWRRFSSRRKRLHSGTTMLSEATRRVVLLKGYLCLKGYVRGGTASVVAPLGSPGVKDAEVACLKARLEALESQRSEEGVKHAAALRKLTQHVEALTSKREGVYTRCDTLHDELTSERIESARLQSRAERLEADKKKLTALVTRLQSAQNRSNEQLKAAVEDITLLKARQQ